VNGLGERAGNTSLEEVVMAVRTRGDFFNLETRIDASQIRAGLASRVPDHRVRGAAQQGGGGANLLRMLPGSTRTAC